jgi:uncharacterized protein YjiS (DUF1127 family)
MGKKRPPKTTPEEWARYEANTQRLYELAEKAVADLGMTRQELFAKLGLPDSDPRTA